MAGVRQTPEMDAMKLKINPNNEIMRKFYICSQAGVSRRHTPHNPSKFCIIAYFSSVDLHSTRREESTDPYTHTHTQCTQRERKHEIELTRERIKA